MLYSTVNQFLKKILFVLGVFFSVSLQAVAATAIVSVDVVSPAEVSMDAAAEVLKSTSVGVLTLTIPGGSTMTMTTTGAVTGGGASVFTTSDSAGLSEVIQALMESGGSLVMGGMESSGQGVYITITQAVAGEQGGTVYATVAYN